MQKQRLTIQTVVDYMHAACRARGNQTRNGQASAEIVVGLVLNSPLRDRRARSIHRAHPAKRPSVLIVSIIVFVTRHCIPLIVISGIARRPTRSTHSARKPRFHTHSHETAVHVVTIDQVRAVACKRCDHVPRGVPRVSHSIARDHLRISRNTDTQICSSSRVRAVDFTRVR